MSSGSVARLQKPGSNNDQHSPSRAATSIDTRTAVQGAIRSLRSYVSAVTAFKNDRKFQVRPSIYRKRAVQSVVDDDGPRSAGLTTLYVGVSAVWTAEDTVALAIAIRDTVYLHDFSVSHLKVKGSANRKVPSDHDLITEHIVHQLFSYERENLCKFIGAGIPLDLMEMAPALCSQLWSKLDIIPISMDADAETNDPDKKGRPFWDVKEIDEQADSMARKCIMYFGPEQSPLLQVGFGGLVEIDAGFQSRMCSIKDYEATCGEATWASMLTFAIELKKKGTKIAFFSSTPQGGGVALMRHALVRFARVIGVDLSWYVPKPKPGVFRITKNVHNILQGVAKPDERISSDEKQILTDWIKGNADRYWLSEGGPLRDPSEGGADVIIIDDPQMPGLIPLAKEVNNKRPVFYRSHIQIRSDLIEEAGSPQADIWQFLWEKIQHADLFISHPISSFVPKNVPRSKLAYLPATTDWIDGLNKTLDKWDIDYYVHVYNMECLSARMTQLKYPDREYFIQVARFDPSKGILDVIKSYAEFCKLLRAQSNIKDANGIPQLLIVGNGSVDDPDGTMIYDMTMSYLEKHADLIPSISMMRLPPNDQLLNTLLSNAHTVFQLSTREGFEVKVSEALHKGRPVIATLAGGIPLQVQNGKNGFLVEPGDWKTTAQRLMELWKDEELHQRMSTFASSSVSDEVGTVGNALSWFYLAAKWTVDGGEIVKGVEPDGRWVNDLARQEAGRPYKEGENRLPRST